MKNRVKHWGRDLVTLVSVSSLCFLIIWCHSEVVIICVLQPFTTACPPARLQLSLLSSPKVKSRGVMSSNCRDLPTFIPDFNEPRLLLRWSTHMPACTQGPTCFDLAAESRGLLESSGGEGQTSAFPQAVLQHRFKLGAETDHSAETKTKMCLMTGGGGRGCQCSPICLWKDHIGQYYRPTCTYRSALGFFINIWSFLNFIQVKKKKT